MTRFLVDANLPRRLADLLHEFGHDAIHTSGLPAGNRSTEYEINSTSLRENRIVVTKDADFVQSFLLKDQPHKLLFVRTENIHNR